MFVLLTAVTVLAVSGDMDEDTILDQCTNEVCGAASRAVAVYGNVRGFHQAACEIAIYMRAHSPHFGMFCECHLDPGEPLNRLMPHGYKVVARLDRTAHGGGLLMMSRNDLLCDVVDMKEYNTVEHAELIGMKYDSVTHLLGYTNKSNKAHILIDAITQYKLDHPNEKVIIYGDFNVHNMDWVCSTKVDSGGELAQEFAELFGMQQIISFPTRKESTLIWCLVT